MKIDDFGICHVEIGDVYGFLTVIEEVSPYQYLMKNNKIKKKKRFKCICNSPYHDMPKETIVYGERLLLKNGTRSCGCISRHNTILRNKTGIASLGSHYKTHHPIYTSYRLMIDRCYNKNSQDYYEYGGRGITVCDEWFNPNDWHDINKFKEFFNWSYIYGGYVDGFNLTIDRINVNSNYCPENCRYANIIQQNNNKRNSKYVNFNGNIMTIGQLSDILGVDYDYLYGKLYNNNYDLSNLFKYIDTPYGKKSVLLDKYGNIIPINCLYFIDKYGFYINQNNYNEYNYMIPCCFWVDSNGFIIGPMDDNPNKPIDTSNGYIIKPGDIFGKLTVLEKTDAYISPSGSLKSRWLCKCECGNIVKIPSTDLRAGKKTCGRCNAIKPGDKFDNGNITVIEKVDPYRSPNGKTESKYRCSKYNPKTGETTEVFLRSGRLITRYKRYKD